MIDRREMAKIRGEIISGMQQSHEQRIRVREETDMSEASHGKISDQQMIDDLAAECERLRAEIRRLRAENERLEREHTKAIKDLQEYANLTDLDIQVALDGMP